MPWSNEIRALRRRETRELALRASAYEGHVCVYISQRQLSASLEKRPHRKLSSAGTLILDF